jgi:hypothetical protein
MYARFKVLATLGHFGDSTADGLVKRRRSLNQSGGRPVAAVTFKVICTVQYDSRASRYIERMTGVLGDLGHRRENILSIYIGRVDITDSSARMLTHDRGHTGAWAPTHSAQ